ncbi:hypothetical protein [Lactobacillus crispatus]|uniref:hypothetical protein n=1 Tax=Lactobacillus crispatus TaxID=47770 RepID=UPI001F095692|nr:hypothetical protein [Lactobacillus crispatus]MCT7686932.1 hypothetical protein [Lactobacillus crispatus]MDK7331580.1 hypothetical protein [Lactobacillus crispatus]MDK8154205.1 hypothetical protein [Lactobacillus crispatus]
MNDKVAETLAINTGNMIASLNVQVAKLQVALKEQKQVNDSLKEENDQLKIENAALRKKVKANESSANSTNNQQDNK